MKHTLKMKLHYPFTYGSAKPWLITIILAMSIIQHPVSIAAPLNFSSGDQQSTVIELYTSEGCSSCPPAERWLNSLKDNPKLWTTFIPLAFHVDYWDYIGWKDPYASPAHTQRQSRYHREGGIKTVYTPGFIANGSEWRPWLGMRSIPLSSNNPGQLTVDVDNNALSAEFLPATNHNTGRWRLNVAVLGFGLSTEIKSGENEGKKLEHEFVVLGTDHQVSNNGKWTMPLPAIIDRPTKQKGLAVWVSSDTQQAPIQAVGGWLE